MALIFSALIAINVYFFFLRGGTSLRALLRSSQHGTAMSAAIAPSGGAPSAPPPPAARPKAVDEVDEARVVESVLGDRDTFERALRREGLGAKEVAELAQTLGKVFDLKTVQKGQTCTLRYDGEGHLGALDFRLTPALAFHLERGAEGWSARRDEKPLETKVAEIGGVIGSSLYDAV
jgi:hypothetical protein